MFANPRGFSQLTTSFVAFESLGIPHLLFLTFSPITAPFAKTVTASFSFLNNVNELLRPPEGDLRDNSDSHLLLPITDYPLGTLVENKGVEPLTSCVQSRRSSQLS